MKLTKALVLTLSLFTGLLSSGSFANYGKTAGMKEVPRATITFGAGSSTLTEMDKSELRKFIKDVQNKDTIDQVTVAAWSDKMLPRQGQKLTEADRVLADNRAQAISDFLKTELSIADIDKYNMAESANWLARTFNTKDAELKSVFGKKGADNPVTDAEFKAIRSDGGPSMAVVVAECEKNKKAPTTIPTP